MPQDTRDVVGLGLALAARSPNVSRPNSLRSNGWDGSSFGALRM